MDSTPASVTTSAQPHPAAGLPWWRIKWMWLIVGIPTATVLAVIATVTLALNNFDPPVRDSAAEPAHIRQATANK